MKLLNAFEINQISGGIVTLVINGSEMDVTLSNQSDRIDILRYLGFSELVFKGDGKAFSSGNYIETSINPCNVYTPDNYYQISKATTGTFHQFKVTRI